MILEEYIGFNFESKNKKYNISIIGNFDGEIQWIESEECEEFTDEQWDEYIKFGEECDKIFIEKLNQKQWEHLMDDINDYAG